MFVQSKEGAIASPCVRFLSAVISHRHIMLKLSKHKTGELSYLVTVLVSGTVIAVWLCLYQNHLI